MSPHQEEEEEEEEEEVKVQNSLEEGALVDLFIFWLSVNQERDTARKIYMKGPGGI
jgi:hypothetical protein